MPAAKDTPPPGYRARLSRLVLVRPGELPALAAGFGYFFFLLFSYYTLRPLRDEMGIRSGVGQMQWLFSATFIAMLLAVPLFALLASRYRRTRLVALSYGFFIACILGFWLWLESGRGTLWAARAFFVWLSVFNLFVVSVFWSLMSDIFDHRQAARLFAVVAAGGSLGAVLGPTLTALLAQQIAPRHLLLLAAGILALTLPCLWQLQRWKQHQTAAGEQDSSEPEALGGSLLEGVRALLGSRYLLGICLFIWLYTTLATFLYFTQAEIVQRHLGDSGDRTTLFALLDAATNLLTVLLQLFVTARLVRRFGLPRTLAAVPLLVLAGLLLLAMLPMLLTIGLLQVLRRAGNYAIAKPGREMLFTVLPRMQKYKSKNVIDTVVYRGGDAIAGWVYALLASAGFGTG
ncbi:MAG: MFS transporter, partial [Sedimenticola sp.]|nr:MFS transporter [Sedimenticola sp.]